MVRELSCDAEAPRIEITFHPVSGNCSPSSKWVRTLLRVGEGLGGEGRVDGHHPSHAVPSDTCETLTVTAPMANRLWNLPLP